MELYTKLLRVCKCSQNDVDKIKISIKTYLLCFNLLLRYRDRTSVISGKTANSINSNFVLTENETKKKETKVSNKEE